MNEQDSLKKQLRKIFHVYEKNIQGETLDDMLTSVAEHRPELAPKVEAVQALLSFKAEPVLEKGSILKCSGDLYPFLSDKLSDLKQEEFWVIYLDNKHRILDSRMISRGTLNQTLVHPREVYAPAVELRAASIIVSHNHPSGDPDPSPQDKEVTQRLFDTGKLLGIQLLDHIVIGSQDYFSFIDKGIFPTSIK